MQVTNSGSQMHTVDGPIGRGVVEIPGKVWAKMKKHPSVTEALESGRLVEGDEDKAAKVKAQKDAEADKAADDTRKAAAKKTAAKKKTTKKKKAKRK